MMRQSHWRDRVKRVEELAQSFHHCPLSSPYKPRLSRPWQPSTVWRLFPRQSEALIFGQSCKQDVHVFALEKEHAKMGHRIYLVTSYAELWHYYKTYRQSLMHCYEVIPEGAVCKLYFDLEFHKPSNRSLDGRKMVVLLIQYVCCKLEEVYGVKCSSKDVLNLDSSTEDKFSRHLIFLLPNVAFKDNTHVGHFINKILKPVLDVVQKRRSGLGAEENTHSVVEEQLDSPQAKRQKQGEEDLHFLLVKDKEGRDQLFVDLGVYTKNRNFRLYKSSKVGKNAAFKVAEDNAFVAKPDKRVSAEESIFLASLVSNVSFTGQKILTCEAPLTKEAKCLLSPAPRSSSDTSDCIGGYQHSPYKEVDDFVLSLVTRDGVNGSIRRWSYFVSEQLLVYDILKYRWCQNVGRFHKSNNIMILVDLKEEVWYQKCHDPACRSENYRSSNYPLPKEICVSYFMKESEEEEVGYQMDEEGNIEPSQKPAAAERGGRGSTLTPCQGDDWADDQACVEALEDAERGVSMDTPQHHADDVPDGLLLQMLAEYESP
ncbi:DNA-directed primase/polymerase protein [Megalops cyprinoides]|uniref:DNA-directed primase/polymerase protein n=1 Tax=Megalops cyprinoides TaxID=118141 RepID=UPI00186451EF|nr:DNA-directed primase/polymerase protein [Megalops cyprinoides]